MLLGQFPITPLIAHDRRIGEQAFNFMKTIDNFFEIGKHKQLSHSDKRLKAGAHMTTEKKKAALPGRRTVLLPDYFWAYFLRKRSIRPAVSISFCLPV